MKEIYTAIRNRLAKILDALSDDPFKVPEEVKRNRSTKSEALIKCPYCKNLIPEKSNFCPRCRKKVRKVCNCWVKKIPYDCGMDECPGYDLWIIEKRRGESDEKSSQISGK